MTRSEHLLTILAEECNEVAQRASKALRFGIHEVQPGQASNNAERIEEEFLDLIAIKRMLSALRAEIEREFLIQEEREAAKVTLSPERKAELNAKLEDANKRAKAMMDDPLETGGNFYMLANEIDKIKKELGVVTS